MRQSKCLTLIQASYYRWDLINPAGTILLSDLFFPNAYEAEEWVKCYVSSWPTYEYEVIPREFEPT